MAHNNRDNFPERIRRAVALRASYLCSFCRKTTVGPSDESSVSSASFGVAAHICAAAPGPGARRYDPAMSSEDRSSIENAIWLCSNDATLIDRDEKTYTADYLRNRKRAHEDWCSGELLSGHGLPATVNELVAIGPDIVCVGELRQVNDSGWTVHLKHFVEGDLAAIIAYSENFNRCRAEDRYILLNELGDGRQLAAPPSITKQSSETLLSCPVKAAFPRIRAQDLPADLKFYPESDLSLTATGDLAMVAGLQALDQKIWACLSVTRGEMWFNPTFGTRFSQYCNEYQGTPWLGGLLKLEVIRQAAIPYNDVIVGASTPLACIESVRAVEALDYGPKDDVLRLRVELQVNGLEELWLKELDLHVPSHLVALKHSLPNLLKERDKQP